MNTQSTRERILIVDDTPDNIDILTEILSGYKLSIATNGERGLKLANSENTPDLILLDIMMPGMDGYEVCRRLKANEKTKNIPVIFLTAKADFKSEEKGLALGAVDYISIPISPPIVLQRVEIHLSLKLAVEALEKKFSGNEGELIAAQIRGKLQP
jgi:putative two-component system response regulator